MRSLYHFPLEPKSRMVRILLAENALEFELINEEYWNRREGFLSLNPAGELPVLQEDTVTYISGTWAIIEYIKDKYTKFNHLDGNSNQRAEIRRITEWFLGKFNNEVTRYVLNERLIKHVTNGGYPDSNTLRIAKRNLDYHLSYIAFLLGRNKWLASDNYSLADIAAAAEISVLDYLGEIPWEKHPQVKEWYAVIKSRPAFEEILKDRVSGFIPPKYYANVDF